MLTNNLKEKTANFHDEIESKLESKKLFEGTFSDENYYKMLQVNHLFLKEYAEKIKRLLAVKDLGILHQTNFDKCRLIEKDLTELNLTELEAQNASELEDRAEAFGALYVIEGSMLGGNVIAKTLKKYPNLKDKSFNYFGHYGEKLGQSWKTFLRYINEEFTTEKEQSQVIAGAKKAYEDLIRFA